MGRAKVLMLGWEYPPVVSGGLGTACKGLFNALSEHADLSVILPKSSPDYIHERISFTGLNNLEEKEQVEREVNRELQTFYSKDYVEISLDPYFVEHRKTFESRLSKSSLIKTITTETVIKHIYTRFSNDDSLYGADVVDKVRSL